MSDYQEDGNPPKRALDPAQDLDSTLPLVGEGDGEIPVFGSRFSAPSGEDEAVSSAFRTAQIPDADRPSGTASQPPQFVASLTSRPPRYQTHPTSLPPNGVATLGAIYSPPEKQTGLPTTETRYPLFWRSPAWKWWKSILALLVAGVLGFLALAFVPLIAIWIDFGSGRLTMEDMEAMLDGTLKVTPNIFLFNNLGIALCIPLAFLVGTFFRQRPGYLSSVIGKFRWKWFALVALTILPIWLGILALELVPEMRAGEFVFEINDDTVFMIFAILLTTPFQCAGEEYLDRGVINRGVASFWNHRFGGPLLGAVASSGVFMLMHSAADVFLNVFYFSFGMVACWLTWRTGGLEAAIAVHVVNNMTSMITLPFSDFSEMFDRTEGAADATTLGWSMLGPVLAIVTVEILYRWRHPVAKSAPGLDEMIVPNARVGTFAPANQLLSTGHTAIPVFPSSIIEQLTPTAHLSQGVGSHQIPAGIGESKVDLEQLPPPTV